MSVVAEMSIQSTEFLLGQVLSRDPGTHIEMERVVPASRQVMPYIWVGGADLSEFERLVRESPHVQRLVAVDTFDTKGLYRVEWAEEVESLIYGISKTEATILEAQGTEVWTFRLRFNSHRGLARFHNYCRDHEIEFSLERVYSLGELTEEGDVYQLTESQRRVLKLAVERGYFAVPRDITLSELATELDRSSQTVSEHIRRGSEKVISHAIGNRSNVRQIP